MESAGTNAEQIDYWNHQAGPRWVAQQQQLDGHIGELGHMTLERAGLAPGERVLDVGCGCGASTLEIARRVGAGGSVLGIDVSKVMLERARVSAQAEELRNARFLLADAQIHPFEAAAVDCVYSRFGVMFFAEPDAAFRNLQGALAPGGRLCFVCWQSLDRNPWMLVPLAAAAQHLELPAPPPPGAPGPFSLADPDRVRAILEGAGFAGIGIESVERTLTVGGEKQLERAVNFLMEIGPAASALRKAEPRQRDRVAAAVSDALAPYTTSEGVRMPCAAWIVTARSGGEGSDSR